MLLQLTHPSVSTVILVEVAGIKVPAFIIGIGGGIGSGSGEGDKGGVSGGRCEQAVAVSVAGCCVFKKVAVVGVVARACWCP